MLATENIFKAGAKDLRPAEHPVLQGVRYSMKEPEIPSVTVNISPVQSAGRSGELAPTGQAWIEKLAALTTGYTPQPEREQQETTYYDYPVLKAPTWRWQIIWYFFFGGLAAGSYLIASIASLWGAPEDRRVVRAGWDHLEARRREVKKPRRRRFGDSRLP